MITDTRRNAADRPGRAGRLPGVHPAPGLRPQGRSRTRSPKAAGRRASAAASARTVVIDALIDELGPYRERRVRIRERARPHLGHPRGRQRRARAAARDHGRSPGGVDSEAMRARSTRRFRNTRRPPERRLRRPAPVRRISRPGAVTARGAATKIQIGVFEGPLDLLLFLIKKKKIEIQDIPIAVITRRISRLSQPQGADQPRPRGRIPPDGRAPHLYQVPDPPAARAADRARHRSAQGAGGPPGRLPADQGRRRRPPRARGGAVPDLAAGGPDRAPPGGGPRPHRGLALRPGRIVLRHDEAQAGREPPGHPGQGDSRWPTR